LNILLNSIETKAEVIRKYCYRGVGNVSYLSSLKDNQKVINYNLSNDNLFTFNEQYSTAIIKLILRGLDDSSIQCIKEALASFQRVIEALNPDFLLEYLGELLHKLRNSFENDEARIRMSSFNLVGKIYNVLYKKKADSRERITEDIHFNLISIFLHLNDESDIVKKACLSSLKDLSEILCHPELM